MKLARIALLVAFLGVNAPAHAYTQKEADILLDVSYAITTAKQKNRRGAEAFCRQAKGLITKAPEDAYLNFHIERCFGSVAAESNDKPTACKRYKKALAVWDKSPPPDDHPQSVASRTALRDALVRYRKENCPS